MWRRGMQKGSTCAVKRQARTLSVQQTLDLFCYFQRQQYCGKTRWDMVSHTNVRTVLFPSKAASGLSWALRYLLQLNWFRDWTNLNTNSECLNLYGTYSDPHTKVNFHKFRFEVWHKVFCEMFQGKPFQIQCRQSVKFIYTVYFVQF